jgi:hypothetical protein
VTGRLPAPPWLTAERSAAIAVCLAACLPYLRTVTDYFVQDDFGVVQLLASKPWSTFPRWFTMPWMEDIWGYTPDEIRPFPALSYQLTALWGAGAPYGHHLLNIALHALNGLLVLRIARRAAHLSLAASTAAAIVFVLLPVDAESVAWITGRVDSMPTLFYLASFLAYVDSRKATDSVDRSRRFAWSLVFFFLALFSKQNTITMPAAIVAYDLVVARRPIRLTWAWLRPYVPFVLMTAGFLGVRYLVLGEVLRESQLNAARFAEVGGIFSRHLQRIVVGDLTTIPPAIAGLSALFALAALVALSRIAPAVRWRIVRSAVYFGPIWIGLGLAPAVAAGYESPRHVYLAAVGWALLVGLAADAMREGAQRDTARSSRLWRIAAITMSIAIASVYAVKLHGVVSDWRRRAHAAKTAVAALETQSAAAAPGTLIVIGAPVSSWEWAMPFAARPPFARTDLTARVEIVTPRLLHCCRGRYWDDDTRRALARWTREPGRPVVALYVLPSGEVRRLSGDEDPDLVRLVSFLPEIADSDNLDGAIVDLLRKLVAGRGTIVSPAP